MCKVTITKCPAYTHVFNIFLANTNRCKNISWWLFWTFWYGSQIYLSLWLGLGQVAWMYQPYILNIRYCPLCQLERPRSNDAFVVGPCNFILLLSRHMEGDWLKVVFYSPPRKAVRTKISPGINSTVSFS